MDELQVIFESTTGHQVSVRKISKLGTHGVEVVSDIVAGDGRSVQRYTDDEMTALCAWWIRQSVDEK